MRWKDDIMKWQGATWTRTAKDRKKWKELTEGYFQQWRGHSLGTRYKVQLMTHCTVCDNMRVTKKTYSFD